MSKHLLKPARILRGALVLEFSEATATAHRLHRDKAGALAREIAHDLVGFDPNVSQLSMSTVGTHYDPIELLRPGWPLFDEIDQLSARAPNKDNAQVIAFSAHDGVLPGQLTPADEHLGGTLRVIPFVLRGEAATATAVSAYLERDLIEHGMAGTQTVLLTQDAFAFKIERAHYLTLHDLCAMTALQYEHAGLAALWPLIETALFSPEREQWLDSPPEPLLGWCEGEVKMATLTDAQWQQRYTTNATDIEKERLQKYVQARQRQFSLVLAAHAIRVREVPLSDLHLSIKVPLNDVKRSEIKDSLLMIKHTRV